MLQRIVMLADDDSDDTEMFFEAVEIAAPEVTCYSAVNGSALLKKIDALDKLPEIIFLDMNMPIMNGRQCLEVLKADTRYQKIPVVMISTSSHKGDVDTCLKAGALCYLVKPSDFTILIKLVKEILKNIGAGAPYPHLLQSLRNSGHVMCN